MEVLAKRIQQQQQQQPRNQIDGCDVMLLLLPTTNN
jgi:hypothetical protein